jgi:hypothetical protein
MRVRHLNDFELQGLLDRRGSATPPAVPGIQYVKDLEAQEHLDNCAVCRAEMELYRELFGQLQTTEPNFLPRNFARKVTFSLPPFRAWRTRARLQFAALWGAALITTLLWLMLRIDWSKLVGELLLIAVPKINQVAVWLSSVWELIPVPEFNFAALAAPFMLIYRSVGQAFTLDFGPTHLVILAIAAVFMIDYLDRVFLSSLLSSRQTD